MKHNDTIEGILIHNKAFVEHEEYEHYRTDKYPGKKLAIVSCMDTRLTKLLPAALGLENGDAKIIAVAGAGAGHPFGDVMRSILIAVCELGVETIMVVAHTTCGAQHMNAESMISAMKEQGVADSSIEGVKRCGYDLDSWLEGFGDTEQAVRTSVTTIKNHPLMPPHVCVEGFIIDSATGGLSPVEC